MTITDEQVALLQAQLAGRVDEYRRLLDQIDKERANVGYDALVSAGFFEAARRRFITDGKPAGDAEVVQYVADVRRRTDSSADKIDPDIAERSINFVLGKLPFGANDDIDGNAGFQVKLLLLAAFVGEEQFNDAELDTFMARVRELAEESLS
ncbi:hypothetical protein OHR68_06675 [Spirillospora sp. NBC_00431]